MDESAEAAKANPDRRRIMNAPRVDEARSMLSMAEGSTQSRGHTMSLQKFIEANHSKLVSMTREKVQKRTKNPRPHDLETRHGVHILLDQLRDALVAEARRDPAQQAEADPPTNPKIAITAALHGHDLLGLGFSVDEVVDDYGDVCQAVTELAVELDAPVSVADFHTLNRCLDNAIAAAVTAWAGARDTKDAATEGQRAFKDEKLRRLVSGSILLFEQVRAGKVAAAGRAAMVLGQNLERMRIMLDTALS